MVADVLYHLICTRMSKHQKHLLLFLVLSLLILSNAYFIYGLVEGQGIFAFYAVAVAFILPSTMLFFAYREYNSNRDMV